MARFTFSSYNSVRLTRDDIRRVGDIHGLQELVLSEYKEVPDLRKLARHIARDGKQNYYRNGCRHRVTGLGRPSVQQFPNFICYLGRIIKAEARTIDSRLLSVSSFDKHGDEHDVFAKHAYQLPSGKEIVEHVFQPVVGGHIMSHNLMVIQSGVSSHDVEYYSSTDAY